MASLRFSESAIRNSIKLEIVSLFVLISLTGSDGNLGILCEEFGNDLRGIGLLIIIRVDKVNQRRVRIQD